MTLAIVFYGLVAGGLATLGAWALTTVFRMAGRPERWVWFSGLAVAIALGTLPLTGASDRGGVIRASAVYSVAEIRELPGAAETQKGFFAGARDAIPTNARIPWFMEIWGGTSMALLILGVGVEIRHRRRVGHLRRARLEGLEVWLSRDEGPVVRGALTPRMILPERIDELDDRERELVLAHEVEHLRARDPQLNAVAFLAVVLMPWNPFVWILRRRVAVAIESDCDRRALRRRDATPRDYVAVLLTVASWSLSSPPAPFRLAMGRSARDLRQRVDRVLRPSPPKAAGAVAGILVLGIGAVAPALADPPGPPVERTAGGTVMRSPDTDVFRGTFRAREVSGSTLRLGPAPSAAESGDIARGVGAFTARHQPTGRLDIRTQVVEGDPRFEALAREWLTDAGTTAESDSIHVWVAVLPDGSWRASPVSDDLYDRRGLRGRPDLTLDLLRVWATLEAGSGVPDLPTVEYMGSVSPAHEEVGR